MSTPKIRVTENYSLFKTITGNRRVRPAHVKNLKASIELNPSSIQLSPIMVNEYYEVIDGQHRLEAIKQLNLPVYYIQQDGLDLNTVRAMNSSAKQWQPVDYANAFAELNNKNYMMYLDAKDSEYPVNHDCLIKYLSLDNPITNLSFKAGKLRVEDFERSMELLKQLYIFRDYPRFKQRNFALAFLKIATDERFDAERMQKQVNNKLDKLEDKASEVDYFVEINRIYNLNLTDKVYFGTPEYLSKASK